MQCEDDVTYIKRSLFSAFKVVLLFMISMTTNLLRKNVKGVEWKLYEPSVNCRKQPCAALKIALKLYLHQQS